MSNLSVWARRDPFARDPFAQFDALFRRFAEVEERRAGFVPAAEIARDGDDAVVRLELPGLDAEKDVTVEIEGGRLVVRGERRDERSEEGDGRTLREVRYGAFRRSFGLPAHVTADAVTASYDAGVLTVRVSGVHAGDGARRIPVTAGSPAIESPEENTAA
ncbi:heat-shock protein Hsp20 [Pseudonocardia sp. CNS-139]|nr:heat-shock protein Hsp20 [Pseudonocardia sp. CNS-139]